MPLWITHGVQDNHEHGYDAHGCCGPPREKRRRSGVNNDVLVKMLVSMVNFTMLTRAWLLKRPSLFLSFTSCTVR